MKYLICDELERSKNVRRHVAKCYASRKYRPVRRQDRMRRELSCRVWRYTPGGPSPENDKVDLQVAGKCARFRKSLDSAMSTIQ